MRILTRGHVPIVALFAALVAVAGCSQSSSGIGGGLNAVKSMVIPTRAYGYQASEKERQCLARAMFFESNRSSRDGLVAVGSVVMNRKDSGKWGDDICGVVGAKRQFAPGVLSRPMNSKALPDVMAAADSVLKGERHPKVSKDVMFFHTAGLKFPYKNMRYTTVAGGNAFYYKAGRKQDRLPIKQMDTMPGVETVMVAQAEQPAPATAQDAVFAGQAEPAAVTQVAFAGDTPTARKPVRTSLFGKRQQPEPVEPVATVEATDEAQVALADQAPIPTDRAEPLPEAAQMAFATDAPLAEPLQRPRKTKLKRQQPAETTATLEPDFDAPSEERFGGAQPAYADTGLSDGDGSGNGVLGRLVVEGN